MGNVAPGTASSQGRAMTLNSDGRTIYSTLSVQRPPVRQTRTLGYGEIPFRSRRRYIPWFFNGVTKANKNRLNGEFKKIERCENKRRMVRRREQAYLGRFSGIWGMKIVESYDRNCPLPIADGLIRAMEEAKSFLTNLDVEDR
ncbi:unnamed protein product [Nesidiocoris tenuis]|uniref:Uncharacterized protein n=1 Tax=Nesidiocoris tenuis TaxID=355587 RepID=A0A6H5G1Z6_9HEMI|nr:unnamed protein product [Nesidiocoris tenuis]